MSDVSDEFSDLVQLPVNLGALPPDSPQEVPHFGAVPIEDFQVFQTPDTPLDEGEYRFVVEQSAMNRALKIVSATTSATTPMYWYVKLTLMPGGKLKLSTFDSAAFTETIVDLREEVSPPLSEHMSLAVVYGQIAKCVGKSTDSVLVFRVYAKQSLVVLDDLDSAGDQDAGVGRLTSQLGFPEYHSNLGEFQHQQQVSPVMLQRALSYLSLIAAKDSVQDTFSLVESRNGEFVGGTSSILGRFVADGLDKLTTGMKFAQISQLLGVVGYFNTSNTHLFSVGDHFVLRDEVTYFGWQKPSSSFRDVSSVYDRAQKSRDYVLVARPQLVNIIDWLTFVSSDPNLTVRFTVTGPAGPDAKLRLCVVNTEDFESFRVMRVRRIAKDPESSSEFEDLKLVIRIQHLIKIAAHFSAPYLRVERAGKKGMLVTDESEDGDFKAQTLFENVQEVKFEDSSKVRA